MSNDFFIDDLKTRRTELEANMAEAKKSIIKIESALNEVNSMILKCEGKKSNYTRKRPQEIIEKNDFSKMTITDSIYQLLVTEKKPLPISEIAERIKNGGYPTSASDFKKVINSVIGRDRRFSSIHRGKGIWGLSE